LISFPELSVLENKHHPDGCKKHSQGLLELIAREINCDISHIFDLELNIIDSSPSIISGLYEEFISSGRIDNLASTYCAMKGISETDNSGKDIKMFIAFDNEECGSLSMTGADSAHVENSLRRILSTLPGEKSPDFIDAFFSRSFIISADMAHAVHPNFSEKHQSSHSPTMHGGVVIKTNPNTRYATEPVGASIVRCLAERNNIKTQEFIVRNDSPCGTTIGPILAGQTGIRVVDIGGPMWSMHSIREMMGTDDMHFYLNFMKAFYNDPHPLYEDASLG